MASITIGSSTFSTYGTVAEADTYLEGDFGAALWRAEADEDQKARALVTATRVIDRMCYLGDKTDPDQDNAFPRDDMGLDDYPDGAVPQEIIDASFVLAKLIHAGSKVDDNPTPGQPGIKRQKAGSVEVEYFIPTEDPTRLPTSVWEMISKFFCGGTGLGGSIASGVDGCSAFSPGYGVNGPI